MDDFLTIGIDVGGTNFRIGTLNSDGEILFFEKNSSRIFDEGDVTEIMAAEIGKYMLRCQTGDRVRAVAVGIPSLVSRDKRRVISTPNLRGFDNLDFADGLEKRLGIPVYLDRDVNFLLQNDIAALGLDKRKTILGFYVGTGFGNAIYINGSFYSGKNGAAGELGHIPLFGITERCTCGNAGCCETRCSGRYLEQLCEKYFRSTPVRNVFKEHPNSPILKEYVRNLAVPIAAEINILDPDYAVLAGGVLFMEDFPKDILLSSVREKLRKPYPFENIDLRFSVHTQQSGVFGGARYARTMLEAADAVK